MFYADPAPSRANVVFFYRNMMAIGPNYCHIGLGVNALHCVKVLRKNKVRSDVHGFARPSEIVPLLGAHPDCTHAVIQAPCVEPTELQAMMMRFPHVHFLIRIHSQIGFLQVEPGAINFIREYQRMSEGALNLTVSANNEKFIYFWDNTYQGKCLYLPNLYDMGTPHLARWRHPNTKDVLRIGSFGALRLMKNHTTNAAAALLVAEKLGTNLEFYISVNREEHGGRSILQSLRNMFRGLKGSTLVENPWEGWPDFRRTVGTMDLCVQLSMSETFNITTADAAVSGIPTVVGDAIDWVPDDWQASIDNAGDAARVGLWLLHDQDAGPRGLEYLTRYNDAATKVWLDYFSSNPV